MVGNIARQPIRAFNDEVINLFLLAPKNRFLKSRPIHIAGGLAGVFKYPN
ncbi:MAG: hypothetical protein NT039_01490 [Candidatus Berkelbacteria bacterium]|nr:hypothetical protein [Candidatus Berkelbacteria bacterium]